MLDDPFPANFLTVLRRMCGRAFLIFRCSLIIGPSLEVSVPVLGVLCASAGAKVVNEQSTNKAVAAIPMFLIITRVSLDFELSNVDTRMVAL